MNSGIIKQLTIKGILIFLILFTVPTLLWAQSNDILARSEYFTAQETYNNSDFNQALIHLDKAEELLGSTNPKILALKVKSYYNLKQYSKAYEAQKKYFEMNPDPNDSDFNEIVRIISKINSNAANSYVNEGKKLLKDKKYDSAIKELNNALKIDSNNLAAYFYLGMAYQNSNNYEKAKESYLIARSKVNSIQDENTKNNWINAIEFNKGLTCFSLQDYESAIISFNNAITHKPDDLGSYYQLARVYAVKGNNQKALENIKFLKQKDYEKIDMIEADPFLVDIVNSNEYKEIKVLMYDNRDGKSYNTVTIGKQVWMAENLNYEMEDSYCYDNNSTNCQKYGRLYTWEDANKACPDGWHLPSDEEWKELELFLGMELNESNKKNARGTTEGYKLKSTFGWDKSGNGINTLKFSAIPGGYYTSGKYSFVGKSGVWWTSTHSKTQSGSFMELKYYYTRILYSKRNDISRIDWMDSARLSVRCVKD